MANVFVLVKWVEEEESWDVLPIKSCVVQPVNPDSLVGKVADFYWKKDEESAPCSVLAFGKRSEMEKECSKLTKLPPTLHENDDSLKKLGDGMRTVRRPLRLDDPSDEEETSQVPKKKKQKVAPTETSRNILKEVEKRQTAFTSSPDTPATLPVECQCQKYDHLLSKYTKLKEKVRNLKDEVSELQVYKDLHRVVKDLTNYKNEVVKTESVASYVSNDQEVELGDPSPAQKEKVKQMSKVDIGHGIIMEKAKLMAVTQASDRPTKLARNLFVALFPFDEVIGKSLTGKKSNAHNNSIQKEKLDPNRIGTILDFTIKKYPSTPASILRQSLSDKVKEINKTDA